MKIFFLMNTMETGGGERVAADLATRLSKKHDVTIYTIKDAVEIKPAVKIVPLSSIKCDKLMVASFPFILRRFGKIVRSEDPDIVVSFLELANFINVLSGGKKKVIGVRSVLTRVYDKGAYSALVRLLIRKLYPKADIILTNSLVSAKDLRAFGIRNARTCYNPVDVATINKLSSESLGGDESIYKGKVIISVGRLIPVKSHDKLIRSFALVKKQVKDARLVILGSGPLEQELKSLVDNLDLSDSVFLLGNKKNPFKYISRADVFAMTSYYEGFPNALLEAMACGVPVVSTDCYSGPREILEPSSDPFKTTTSIELAEYGVLVPNMAQSGADEKGERKLSDAITMLLKRPSLRKHYSSSGRARACQLESSKMTIKFCEEIGCSKKTQNT